MSVCRRRETACAPHLVVDARGEEKGALANGRMPRVEKREHSQLTEKGGEIEDTDDSARK
jgi:hypothetical protein